MKINFLFGRELVDRRGNLSYNEGMEKAMKEPSAAAGDLQARIRAQAAKSPRMQKHLASFLIDHWKEIPLLSIERIAAKSGVSMASITRFTRRIGCRGFLDFKSRVKGEHLRRMANPVERFFSVPPDLKGKNSLIQAARQDVRNINVLLASISVETFRRLSDMIDRAERVYAYGVGISSILASLVTYTLNQIQKCAVNLDDGDIPVEEKIFCARPGELILFFSFFPYSRCTAEFARLAHDRDLPIVLFTDNEYSPLARTASLVLKVPRENILFTTSISALSVLFNAVATEIALGKKEELSRSLKEMDRKLRPFYL